MSNQTPQVNTSEQPSFTKRLFQSRWFRGVGFFVLAGLVAAVTYVVFGLVPGGSATLRVSPVTGSFWSGQDFVVGVEMDSPSAPVVAVTVVVKYHTDQIIPSLPTLGVGTGWHSSAQIIEKVTSDLVGDPDYNQQLKVTVGQPSPGIQGFNVSILEIPFRVAASKGSASVSSALLTIDGQQSIVVKDDAGGTNILGSVAPPASYTIFPSKQSCSETHPGGMVCVPKDLVYCPAEFRYPAPPGGWVEEADCCQANRCAAIPTLKIIEGTPHVDVVPSGTGGKFQAIFTWSTNVGVEANGVEGGLTFEEASDGSSTRQVLTVSGLAANQTYTVKVWSRQTFNGTTQIARSVDLTFTTGNQNTVSKLLIYDLVADSITNTSARISWTTNFPANGSVSCSPSCFAVMNSSTFSTRHDARLLNLTRGTTYTVVVHSELQPRNPNDPSTYPEIEAPEDREESSHYTFQTTNVAIQDDANIILRVDRDRQCGKWLECVSSVTVKNKQKKEEEMCVARGVCDTLDPETGACLNVLGSAPGSSFSSNYNNPKGSTIDLAANLSGYSRVSNVWRGYEPVGFRDYEASGVESIPTLQELGSSVSVPNGSFEGGRSFPWQPYPQGSSQIRLEPDSERGSTTLSVTPQNPTSTLESFGAKVSLGLDTLSVGKPYYVSFQARAVLDSRAHDRGTKIRVQLLYRGEINPTSNTPNSSYELEVGPGWQQAVLGPFIPPNLPKVRLDSAGAGEYPEGKLGEVSLAIIAPAGLSEYQPRSLSLDNVTIAPVLRAGPGFYLPRICRAYASSSSPACDYFDPFSGRIFRGWKGYCLLPDSRDPTECLQWWPIDVVGSSPFAVETPGGYLAEGGRLPLYYCLEAEGYGPYAHSHFLYSVGSALSCPRGSNDWMEPFAGEGGCSVVKELPGPPYPSSELAAVKVSWYFARDDKTCTLSNREQIVWLSAGNHFESEGSISHNDEGSAITTFKVRRHESGTFFVSVCSSGNGSSGTVWKINATYYFRESCGVIAQVVTPEGVNRAQTDRVRPPANLEDCVRNPFGKECEGNYRVPQLGYWYGSDSAPFGAVLHPDPDLNPEEWTTKLFIEPSFDPSGIGQARGGQPYGVRSREGFCKNNPTVPCQRDADCTGVQTQSNECQYAGAEYVDCGYGPNNPCSEDRFRCSLTGEDCTTGGQPDQNLCPSVVVPECVFPQPYNAQSVCVFGPEIGKACSRHEDCGVTENGVLGYCAGPEKPPSVDWQSYSKALLNSQPQESLSNLFIETYGTWQWMGERYVKICGAGGVPVCVGGENAGESCKDGGNDVCASKKCGYQRRSSFSFGTCLGGSNPGASCTDSRQCGGVCSGGPNDGASCSLGLCSTGGTCDNPGGVCGSGTCSGGIRAGDPCTSTCMGGFSCVGLGTCVASSNTCGVGGTCVPGVCKRGLGTSSGSCSDGRKQYGWGPDTPGIPKGVPPKVRNIRVNGLPKMTKVCPTETSCYTSPSSPLADSLFSFVGCSQDVNDWPFEGIEQYSATLTFNSNVNSNQLPLRRYAVDWGDGTVTSESDLQIRGKDDPENPHKLGHLYRYQPGNPGCDAEKCVYQIRIQIEDNWGWCNENTTERECGLNVPGTPNDARAWAFFRDGSGKAQPITVWKDEEVFLIRHACGPAI